MEVHMEKMKESARRERLRAQEEGGKRWNKIPKEVGKAGPEEDVESTTF